LALALCNLPVNLKKKKKRRRRRRRRRKMP
jgi:hypothetical protein